MAKQTGIHGLKGKVNGMSYYSSKNGGRLTRSINEGLSSRVKTAQEYANTRKNNAEFGMCGDFAGAIIKPISLRWRFILDSIATGKMVKELKKIVVLDSTGKWGERVVGSAYRNEVLNAFNSLSKNQFPTDTMAALSNGVKFDAAEGKLFTDAQILLSEDECARLIGLGATGVKYVAFAYSVSIPVFESNANAYSKAETIFEPVTMDEGETTLTPGSNLMLFDTGSVQDLSMDILDAEKISGVLSIVLPYREVGSVDNVLQQHCYACWTPVSAGTAPEP